MLPYSFFSLKVKIKVFHDCPLNVSLTITHSPWPQMLFDVDYRLPPELKAILERRKNHKDYVLHPNLRSNFPLEFCFSQWMLSGNGGTWIPNGARWSPVSRLLSSQLFTEQPIANAWRTGEHLRAFWNAERCSGLWNHAVCIQLYVPGS